MTAKERLDALERDKVRYEALSDKTVGDLEKVVKEIKDKFNIEPEEIDAEALNLRMEVEAEEEQLAQDIQDRHNKVKNAYAAIR